MLASKRTLLITSLLAMVLMFSVNASAQNITALKEAQTIDGAVLSELEVGQEFRYRLVWSCSFTTTPPPEGCGDFLLSDPLPPGLEFVSCATTNDYLCNESGGIVEIDKIGPIPGSGINLGEGESAEAFITVRLSSDINDFPNSEFPTSADNTATITSGQPTIGASSSVPVNPPENNWTIGKSALIPTAPLNPALDNNAIYRIEICPDGPAGLGTGTIPLTNVALTDSCETGAVFVGATLNGSAISPVAPNDICPNLEFNIGDIAPVDGCQVVDISLQYPSAVFAEGDFVNNTATAIADEGSVDVCDAPCSNSVDQEISPPNPDGNIGKGTRRSELAVGALSQYNINFNLNDSNVVLSNAVIEDIFPSNITVTSFNFNGWDDSTVEATITELGTGNTIGPVPYDGSVAINSPLDASATGFRIDFLGPIPPGFQSNGSITLNFRLDSEPSPPSFTNCVTFSADELLTPAQDCATVDVISPRADIQSIKEIPGSLNPGAEFTANFSLQQDFTSSTGAINPVVVECLPPELLFVSWDTVSFPFGLDDPRDLPLNLTNDRSLGVLPNIEVFAPGDPSNSCTSGGGMLRWSWSSVAPAGSLQLGNAPGVNNPFTFPVYPDRNGDNLSNSFDDPLGELSRVTMGVTLQVAPGTIAVSGLTNTSSVIPESGNYACIGAETTDTQDLDNDGDFSETVCTDTETFNVLSAASIGGTKFVAGFPGLENIDPDNPPLNADAANAGIEPSFCPDDGTDRTRAPCVAQGLASQPFNYLIRLSNDGNVPLQDYIAYDILPYANDVGITEVQSNSPRGSSWTPELLGPIVVSSLNPIVQAELDNIGDLTIPLAQRPRIEYSSSINPCRDEMANGPDGPWQGGACDDDWTSTPLADPITFPNGFGSVAAWRLVMPFANQPWPSGNPSDPLEEDIIVEMPMLAQMNAPASDYDIDDLEIAWNNLGHRATNETTGGRLLAAEVRSTGIVIPQDFPINSVGVRLGNLVWMDIDNDGLAELGEPGIFDVTVQSL